MDIPDEVPEFLDDYNAPCGYMDIPEQYRMVTIPARCFKVKQDNALGNTKAKNRTVYEYDTPGVYEYNTPDVYEHNCTPNGNIYEYNRTPDVYNRTPDEHKYVVLPDRMFKFHNNATREDILGNAGGEEGMRQSIHKQLRPGYKEDEVYGDQAQLLTGSHDASWTNRDASSNNRRNLPFHY